MCISLALSLLEAHWNHKLHFKASYFVYCNRPIGAMLKSIMDSMTANPIAKPGANASENAAINGISKGQKEASGSSKEEEGRGKASEDGNKFCYIDQIWRTI